MVAHPLGTREALRRIRKEKTEAVTDSAQRAKIGQIQDLSDHQQYEDVLTREQALVSGHADESPWVRWRLGLLVSKPR
jgi:hypothetical protein